MELLDEIERRCWIGVVEVHGDDGDLRHASITRVTECGEPGGIGVREGRGEVGCFGVQSGEKRLEVIGGVGCGGERGDVVVGVIGLVEEG